MRADSSQLPADGFCHGLGQFGLEGAGEPKHLGVHCPAQDHGSRATFFVDDSRDAEAGLLAQVFLYRIGGTGRGGRFESGIARDPRDLPNTVVELFTQLGGVGLATCLELVHPA